MTDEQPTYDASSIEVLEGLEAVRRRPGMYIGDVEEDALQHLLLEAVGNVVDLHLRGLASSVRIDLRETGFVVEDDGPGLHPVALHIVFTRLHASSSAWPHVHLASHGIGIAPLNAVALPLVVESRAAGWGCRARFAQGTLEELEDLGRVHESGTRIDFEADPEIFGDARLDIPAARTRLFEVACCNPALTFFVDGERLDARVGGASFLAATAPDSDPWPSRPMGVRVSCENVGVRLAVQWAARGAGEIHGFANQQACNGAHIQGFRSGLLAGARTAGCGLAPSDRVALEQLEEGLRAWVEVEVLDLKFVGPTGSTIVSAAARTAVHEVTERWMGALLRCHPRWHDVPAPKPSCDEVAGLMEHRARVG